MFDVGIIILSCTAESCQLLKALPVCTQVSGPLNQNKIMHCNIYSFINFVTSILLFWYSLKM
jgi:hypothetical protein